MTIENDDFVRDTIGRVHRQQEQILFLTAAVESTWDAMIVSDSTGMVRIFNKGAEELFQIERGTFEDVDNVFHLLEDTLVGEAERLDGARVQELLVNDRPIRNARVTIKTFDGRTVPSLLTMNYMLDSERNRIGIVTVIKDNSEVENLTVTDHLTGLFNRSYFDRTLKMEYERLRRSHMPMLSLVFLDVDDFGKFNKTHGHHVGDMVLQTVANVLKEAIRAVDSACRYGGEEFAVILPATGRQGAMLTGRRICDLIRDQNIALPDGKGKVRVTASVGMNTHGTKTRGGWEGLLRDADEAMREAKKAGKNRAHLHRNAD